MMTLKKAGKDGKVTFEGLKRGDYYFYGIGYDSTIKQTVVGGVPIQLLQKAGEKLLIFQLQKVINDN